MGSTDAWVGIVGVVIGFMLGAVAQYVRHRWRVYRAKRLIIEELKTLMALIPLKQQQCRNAVAAFRQKRMYSVMTVPLLSVAYSQSMAYIYDHLTQLQRNCLHAVYSRIIASDNTIGNFDSDFSQARAEGVIAEPYEFFAKQAEDLVKSYDYVMKAIESYLNGNPIDVFKIGVKEKQSRAMRWWRYLREGKRALTE